MEFGASFWINSILLGIALAMDAFSVSAADALNEPDMKRGRSCLIAGTFAGFQFAMPMIGWFCVHVIAEAFETFHKMTPSIALVLLLYIGGKMLIEGIRGNSGESEKPAVGFWGLMVQGIATAIDALSVGFTISEYEFPKAICSALIIGIVTFAICVAGLRIGRRLGTILAGKASIFGGIILIIIGIEIWVRGVFL